MRILVLFLLVITASNNVKSQESDTLSSNSYVLKLNCFAPGISAEFLIKDNYTIIIMLNSHLEYFWLEHTYYSNFSVNRYENARYIYSSKSWELQPSSNLTLEVRHYLNTPERIKKGKRVDKFSGTYGSFMIATCMSLTSKKYWLFKIGPMVGFQRAIGERFFFDINLGVGPVYSNDYLNFILIGGAKAGVFL